MYGRDPKLPSSLDFQTPVVKFSIIETEYDKGLERELKQARQLAKQHIQSAQRSQKFYDRSSKEVKLNVGDREMLKVQPQFKLDRTFKGPPVIKSLSPTNAMIQVQGDSSADVLNVSRQRLSLCGPAMADATPWIGHSGSFVNAERLTDTECQNLTKTVIWQTTYSHQCQQSLLEVVVKYGDPLDST